MPKHKIDHALMKYIAKRKPDAIGDLIRILQEDVEKIRPETFARKLGFSRNCGHYLTQVIRAEYPASIRMIRSLIHHYNLDKTYVLRLDIKDYDRRLQKRHEDILGHSLFHDRQPLRYLPK